VNTTLADGNPADHAPDATPAGFSFTVCRPGPSPGDAAAIRDFWRSEKALDSDAAMDQRLPQVLMLARASDGRVAGVCTALAITPPRLGQPVYYWRTFVGAAWRSSQLVMALLKRSCALLEDEARAADFPCIGVLLELENARFSDAGRRAEWHHPRFTYIGRSERGLDLRVHYFRGARLKSSQVTPAAG
jgi:hypothetical protein